MNRRGHEAHTVVHLCRECTAAGYGWVRWHVTIAWYWRTAYPTEEVLPMGPPFSPGVQCASFIKCSSRVRLSFS